MAPLFYHNTLRGLEQSRVDPVRPHRRRQTEHAALSVSERLIRRRGRIR